MVTADTKTACGKAGGPKDRTPVAAGHDNTTPAPIREIEVRALAGGQFRSFQHLLPSGRPHAFIGAGIGMAATAPRRHGPASCPAESDDTSATGIEQAAERRRPTAAEVKTRKSGWHACPGRKTGPHRLGCTGRAWRPKESRPRNISSHLCQTSGGCETPCFSQNGP